RPEKSATQLGTPQNATRRTRQIPVPTTFGTPSTPFHVERHVVGVTTEMTAEWHTSRPRLSSRLRHHSPQSTSCSQSFSDSAVAAINAPATLGTSSSGALIVGLPFQSSRLARRRQPRAWLTGIVPSN